MNIRITGKEVKATEAIKAYMEKKVSRLEKYFDENTDVTITIRAEKESQIAEMQIVSNGEVYRAEAKEKDLYASIDKDMDIIEGQIRKNKAKNQKKTRTEGSVKTMFIEKEKIIVENEVIKAKQYEIKPISIEDAKLKLQEKSRDLFLTFVNVDTNKVNVIFKTKDGKNYGIVEPE